MKALKRRPNISSIPDVLKTYQNLQSSYATMNKKAIMEAYNLFNASVSSSFDLLWDDAFLIIQETFNNEVKPRLDLIDAGKRPIKKEKIDLQEAKKLLDQIYSRIKKS